MAEITVPTDDDLKRDAAADMALCEAATRGNWRYDDGVTDDKCDPPERGKQPAVYATVGGRLYLIVMLETFSAGEDISPELQAAELAQMDHHGRLIAAARHALPAWIRRAVAAESEVRQWQAEAAARLNDTMQRDSDAVRAWKEELGKREAAESEVVRLREAIARHHAQKADDRCVFDDDELYAAAGLPPVDRRVGDKAAMLRNCERFIERRCEGGGWPSYAELEAENTRLRAALDAAYATIAKQTALLLARRDGDIPPHSLGAQADPPDDGAAVAAELLGRASRPLTDQGGEG